MVDRLSTPGASRQARRAFVPTFGAMALRFLVVLAAASLLSTPALAADPPTIALELSADSVPVGQPVHVTLTGTVPSKGHVTAYVSPAARGCADDSTVVARPIDA